MSSYSQSQRLFDFAGKKEHETPKAMLIDHGGDEAIWIPKSIVEDNGDGTFTVPEWYAIEKGIA